MLFRQISFHGSDVKKFLQAYTIGDWQQSSIALPKPTAFINHQGRVVCTALVTQVSETKIDCVVLDETYRILEEHLLKYLRFSQTSLKAAKTFEEKYELSQSDVMIWVPSQYSKLFTAHDLSLDVLNWISFDKGCYLGQEIIARMHYLSKTHKKRLVKVPTQLLAQEDPILGIDDHTQMALTIWAKDRFESIHSDIFVWLKE